MIKCIFANKYTQTTLLISNLKKMKMKIIFKISFLVILLFSIQIKAYCDNHPIKNMNNKLNVDSTSTISNKASNNDSLIVYLNNNSKSNNIIYFLPIIGILIGIIINRGLDYLNNRQSIKKAGERWKIELNCLQEPIERQIDIINDYLEKYTKEHSSIPDFNIINDLNCESFNCLDKSELIKYHTMIRNKNREDAIIYCKNIFSIISILTYNCNILKECTNEHIDTCSKEYENLQININNLTFSILEYKDNLDTVNIKDLTTIDCMSKINDLTTKYIFSITDGIYNIDLLKNEYLNQLMENLFSIRKDPSSKNMLVYARNLKLTIDNILMNKKYLSQKLEKIVKSYNKMQDSLKSTLSGY